MNAKYDFTQLFQQFITKSKNGTHKQLNGKRLRPIVIEKYIGALDTIRRFQSETSVDLHICDLKNTQRRKALLEHKRWTKLVKQLSSYLFSRGCHDNYVGTQFKIIKTFLNFVTKEKFIDCSGIINCFKTLGEKIPIIVLDKEQLAYLSGNQEFEKGLSERLLKTKDVFVVGCYTGLRFSDLMKLKPLNLERNNGVQYLRVIAGKTSAETIIKLPEYVASIFTKYKKNGRLLPLISNGQLNKNIKLLCEKAGWTNIIGKKRSQSGIDKTILKNGKPYRFCDLVTTHTMRRTAITNLLLLGMPELMVRQISGHSPGSKAFYRYVIFAQKYMDTEIDSVHSAMQALIDKEKLLSPL